MSQSRSFKPIAGVQASDDEIAAFAARKGIPSLQPVVTSAPVAAPSTPTTTTRFSIELPVYIADDIGMRALKAKCSKRHIVMLALQAAGYDVREEDMIPDGRRLR